MMHNHWLYKLDDPENVLFQHSLRDYGRDDFWSSPDEFNFYFPSELWYEWQKVDWPFSVVFPCSWEFIYMHDHVRTALILILKLLYHYQNFVKELWVSSGLSFLHNARYVWYIACGSFWSPLLCASNISANGMLHECLKSFAAARTMLLKGLPRTDSSPGKAQHWILISTNKWIQCKCQTNNNFWYFVDQKSVARCEIWTHAYEYTRTWVELLRPLGQACFAA